MWKAESFKGLWVVMVKVGLLCVTVDYRLGIATPQVAEILLNTSSMEFTCAHCSDIICRKVLREALNQFISKCISKNPRPVRYLMKKQTTISPCFSLRYSPCSWIYERLGEVLQSYYFFFLSLINMTPIYLSTETAFSVSLFEECYIRKL